LLFWASLLCSPILPPHTTQPELQQEKKRTFPFIPAATMTAIKPGKGSLNANFADKSEEKYIQLEFSVFSHYILTQEDTKHARKSARAQLSSLASSPLQKSSIC
jgi:hypothetical protein